ncbi:glycosyltransferase [Leptolyngbya sp. NIES-2104]|uniref:glycosyltransferase n=1 Tax=Leptolyngbya sp. NIES-2104 TaxID=1552121 RepID=UPI0006EC922F|nr:glycosyltransferase [Leptolyngbya sp. NIES-2104]GAP96517.1 glycosyl transferase, group 1 [Leptolyngbya sp. NIES-2104]
MTAHQSRPKPLISIFLPTLAGGGAERAMLYLAIGLAERGWRVDLVLAEARGEYLDHIPLEIRLIDLRATFPIVVTKTIALRRYLEKEQPAILFSALDILSSAYWARPATVSTQIVMCVQTYLSEQFKNHQGRTFGKARSRMVRWLYPKCDAIVAASIGTAEDVAGLTRLPVDRIQVIYNPVVTQEVFQKSEISIDHPWFNSGEPPVILGIGRLVSQKDFPTLITAFAKVRENRPARLMILGEGDDRAALEALIQKFGLESDVALPGFTENPYAYLSKASLFALSSRFEGFGNVVAEALACGAPVVSTDCPSGPAEILDHGKYGRLIPVADPATMAIAILEMLDSPVDRAALKRRSLEFERDRIVDQYVDLIERLLVER